jgi:tetratricopeptide (TPR) repeat protein
MRSRFKGDIFACCLVFLGQSYSGWAWGAQGPTVDLDAEIQAIKSEVLAISVALPSDTPPAVTADLEKLIDSPRGDVDGREVFAAIRALQQQESRGLLTEENRLLLARLKLAYGLDVEAGFELYAVASGAGSTPAQSRAWLELAETLHRKGYHRAALEAITRVGSELPADLAGRRQLLRAHALMSLGDNTEAAEVLSPWRGDETLAAYGHYNRAIALVRIGNFADAGTALENVVDARGDSEELAALRDRARLSLGHLLAREGDYRRARRQLQAVREEGPFSERAVLALGWLAHEQGQSDRALESWMRLRDGSVSDPAVLETLLLVPALHREQANLRRASRDYELAIDTYDRELDRVDAVRRGVVDGAIVSLLLQGDDRPVDPEAARLLGPLLASRDLQAVQRDHSDLLALLDNLALELQRLDALAAAGSPAVVPLPEARIPPSEPLEHRLRTVPDSGVAVPPSPGGAGGPRGWSPNAEEPLEQSPGIPGLPELESPPRRAVKPLPGAGSGNLVRPVFRGLPQNAEWIKEPPDGEIFGIPDSEIIWLPQSGAFFRRPGEIHEEDYAYPDGVPRRAARDRNRSRQLLPDPEAAASFDAGELPVGDALQDLALALNRDTAWRQAMDTVFDPAATGAERERQIAALRAQIQVLHERIIQALDRSEHRTRTLTMAELERRQRLLEALQERASLELAKTYDDLGSE